MQKTIAVDIDDVTADLVTAWLQGYNEDYNDTVTESDIKTWNIGSHTKIGDKMYEYLTPKLYDKVAPVEDALWGVEKLREFGYRVIFVTSFIHALAGRKYEWLQDNGFIHDIKDYVEARDKSLIKYDYLIDDNPENVINASGTGIVFTREWNKQLKGYNRMNEWTEIVIYFDTLKGWRIL